MLCHRALHERPEVRPRMLVKRPASPEPGPSKSPVKRLRIDSSQSSNSPSVEPNILPEDPETRILYRQLTDDHNKGDDFCLVFNIMGCIS
jgi:hypothetical protein